MHQQNLHRARPRHIILKTQPFRFLLFALMGVENDSNFKFQLSRPIYKPDLNLEPSNSYASTDILIIGYGIWQNAYSKTE